MIPTIIDAHFQEAQSLWPLWQAALRSPEWYPRDLAACQHRLQAHLDGLRLAGESIVPRLVTGLAEEDESIVFTSAYLLLSLPNESYRNLVVDAFLGADGGRLVGLRDALCQCPLGRTIDRLQAAIASGSSKVCLAAAYVLAWHQQLSPQTSRWQQLLNDEDPALRRAAWQVVMLADAATQSR